jgi:phospholipase C
MHNPSPAPVTLAIAECYTLLEEHKEIGPGAKVSIRIPLKSDSRWYDVSVTNRDVKTSFLRRFAGHLEDGTPSTSDPHQFV